MRALPGPPPTSPVVPTFHTVKRDDQLFRIYNPIGPYPATPTSFRYFGPRERFDHHPRVNGEPTNHAGRGIWYGAYQPAASLVEVFGDKREIRLWPSWVTIVNVLRDLTLIDLDGGAMANGTYAAIGSSRGRRLTQRWSSFFYRNTGVYGFADGIYYRSAHNAGLCVALYERARDALHVIDSFSLSDPRFAFEIADAQYRYGMTLLSP